MKIEPIVFGSIMVRLLETHEELINVQKLRYQEMILEYNQEKINETGLDQSPYDLHCDHIIAIDLDSNEIIGTYRLIQKSHIAFIGTFITEQEFNIDLLKNSSLNLLELGRAVIKKQYRGGIVIKLIWKFIFNYIKYYDIRFLFGTASYHGHNPEPYLQSISYLHHHYLISEEYMAYPKVEVNFIPISKETIDETSALHQTPPLIKGYLAMGARIGKGYYIDYDFNSVDILVVLDYNTLNYKYLKRIFK